MKDVQCHELFGGIALKNHAFSFSIVVRPEDDIHKNILLLTHLNQQTIIALNFASTFQTLHLLQHIGLL